MWERTLLTGSSEGLGVHEPDLWGSCHRIRGSLAFSEWRDEHRCLISLRGYQCSAPETWGGKQWPWMFPHPGDWLGSSHSLRHRGGSVLTLPQHQWVEIFIGLSFGFNFNFFIFQKLNKENHTYKIKHYPHSYQQEVTILNLVICWFPDLYLRFKKLCR